MHFVRNREEWNQHKKVWYEGGLQPADIGTNNGRGDRLNPRLGYAMVRLDNWHNTCTIGLIRHRRVCGTICFLMTTLYLVEDSTQLVWIFHMSL